MVESSQDKPDASSIKPVSSLLSHFEKISSARSIPSGPAAPNISLLDQERARSSLDLPRQPPPWNTTANGSYSTSHEGTKTTDKPIPRQLAPGKATRQRPVSTGPWSPPHTPPVLTLQSPVSPPKPVFTSPGQTKLRRHITSDASLLDLSRRPSEPYSLPSRPDGRMHFDPPENFSRSIQSLRSSPIPAKRAHPPPINRASKPTTPTTLAFALDSCKNGIKERISPFNSPPSSDESPNKSSISQRGFDTTKALPSQASYFPPPPVYRVNEAQREATSKHVSHKGNDTASPKEQVRFGSSQDSLDLPHQRPILPSRSNVRASPPRPRPGRSESGHSYPRVSSASKPPPRPSEASKQGPKPPEFLPPPKRTLIPSGQNEKSTVGRYRFTGSTTKTEIVPVQYANQQTGKLDTPVDYDVGTSTLKNSASEYPDASRINRRQPKSQCGVHRVWTEYDTKLFDLCGHYACSGGYITRAWDIRNSRMIMDVAHAEREVKVTAMVFKPGKTTDEEGVCVWLGNNYGEIQEIDLRSQQILEAKSNAHSMREIVKMYRHQNSIWSLDAEGKLHVWAAGDTGVPSLRLMPTVFRVARGHTCSIVVKNLLWLASGKEIRVYNPFAGDQGFNVTIQPLSQPMAGEITSGAVISKQLDKVYFGHSDGKISIYSTEDFTCFGTVNVSAYPIKCLAGAGVYLWAGYTTGLIYVYDTQQQPWRVVKEWHAHDGPVSSLAVDRSSLWKFGHLQLASLGADNAICFWDGLLEDDWIENDMQQHDVEYCTFNEIRLVTMTWNAGASTPSSLRHDEKGLGIFRDIIQAQSPPDIIVFSFQELVDLEDKKLTAKSFFKGSSKKKDPGEAEHMSHQYRAWRDFLVQLLDENMPASETYHLLHTASMVGLFSCVFVKGAVRSRVRNLGAAEVKRGLGGLHGNKGSIMVRFMLDDSSLCFTNCHLAAGQSQTVSRNNDITAILDSAVLPSESDRDVQIDSFTGGGDGSMIMDHEICVISGDLNYRIDTMGRDTVIKAINSRNLNKLLERDQLLVTRRRNPGFRLRSFHERDITFAPTYKYDVGTDRYDSSEKNRSPAWCDRLLYRGAGRIKQVDYRRHELRLSDHRPVSGTFLVRLKTIDQKQRAVVWEQCESRLKKMRQSLSKEINLEYLITVLGVGEKEARRLLEK